MNGRWPRHILIAAFIVAGAWWSMATAQENDAQEAARAPSYPNADILATPEWLRNNLDDTVIIDVRTDEHFDGTVIPGAIRMSWSLLRTDDKARNLAEAFAGIGKAEEVLGQHGITRTSSLVLYDSVKRDGGATASYVFWVLDILGHPHKRVLEGGIDAWKAAGGAVEKTPATLEPVAYKAPSDEIRRAELIDGEFIRTRLSDPHYQILDVRSREEYMGKKGTKGLHGESFTLGHIPGAYNLEYTQAWVDEKTKLLKSKNELQALYAGLDPAKTVIVYCDSGRRGSFSYFILRLMGHPNVLLYEPSWKEWGNPKKYFPVETQEHSFPRAPVSAVWDTKMKTKLSDGGTPPADLAPKQTGKNPTGGYVSCGG